jgi:hypothetical protein
LTFNSETNIVKKHLLFIALLAIIGLRANAQNLDLYASKMGSYDSITGFNNLVFLKVNPYTAAESFIDTLTDIHGIHSGSSTFDQSNHHYIIAGSDLSSNNYLLVIDTNGTVLHENPYLQNIIGYQYDLKNQKLYAIYQDNPPDFNFISFNQDSGNITHISSLNGLGGIYLGSSTFNSNTCKYIFLGVDSNYLPELFIINAITGTIENKIGFGAGSLKMLQYDDNFDKLFGLYQSSTINPNLFYFAEIDTLTADITIIDTLNEITSVSPSSCAYDQTTSSYIFIGYDSLGVRRLYVINSMTGQIISNSQISVDTKELQCDNTRYALNKYHTTNVKDMISIENDCLIYPNPVSNNITIEFALQALIEISNTEGQIIKRLNVKGNKTNIDISDFLSGFYIIRVQTDKGVTTKKFIKE